MSGDVSGRVEAALDRDVRPGLSAHAGSVVLVDARDDGVELEFVGSCRSCYFRASCAVNLVAPIVADAVGRPVPVEIRGVSSALLRRHLPQAG